MKKELVKKILLQMIGAVAVVCCPIYGYYPIAMAFFAAAYRCTNIRGITIPVMLGAFFACTDVETTVKYGVCMLVSAVIYELIIRKKKALGNVASSFVMAGVLWAVEAAGGFMTEESFWYAVLGGFEAVTVLGLAGILYTAHTKVRESKGTQNTQADLPFSLCN